VEYYFLFAALGIAVLAAILDIRSHRIPNWLNYSGFIGAFVCRILVLGWSGLGSGLLGVAAGGAIFLMLFMVGGIGGGDVKLMAAVSAWVGIGQVVALLIATAVTGGVIAIALIVVRGRILEALLNSMELLRYHMKSGLKPHPEINVRTGTSLRLPFAPAIAVGVLYCISQSFSWG